MKKRVLSLALCLVLVVGLFSGLTVNASAGKIDDLKKEIAEKLIKEKIEQLKEEFEIPDLDTDAILSSFANAATSGDFGENNCLHWEVSTGVLSGKTLTISGTGVMPDFNFPEGNLAPWWNYEALGMLTSFGNFKLEGELKKVVIKDGVTNVGSYALFFLPAATQVTLPESVTRIGRYGIAMCSKLTGMSIPKGVTEIGDFGLAGNGLTAVTLPDGLQSLGRGAFDTCTICGQTKNEIIPATGGSTVCPGGPSCPSYGFRDVAGPADWSHEGIDYCVRRSLMVGTGVGTFSPDMSCSRAQIVQVLYNLSGDKTDYSNYYLPFTDVAPGDWFYEAVAWAYANDIVAGTSASTFAPNDVITREQMAVILYGYTAKFAPEFTGNAASLNTFPDAGSVANWAYTAMSWAVGNGLISGMGSGGVSYLAPQGSATRAQASAIIMRYCQLIGQ